VGRSGHHDVIALRSTLTVYPVVAHGDVRVNGSYT